MNNRACLILVSFILSVPRLPGYDIGNRIPEEYTLGICTLEGVGMGKDQGFFLHNIPAFFLSELQNITEHRMSAEEIVAVQEYGVEKEIQSLREEIGSLILQRDELFFTGNQQKRETLLASIEDKREDISILQSGDYEELQVPGVLPLTMAGENLEGSLLNPPGLFRKESCTENGVDLLIYGTLEKVDDFFYLVVEVYNRFTDSVVFREETACDDRELSERGGEIARKLKGVIIGRPWAALRVEADPPSASIYINDRFAGAGSVFRPYLDPGTYSVTCRAPGFDTRRVDTSLEPEAEEEVFLELPERERVTFLVETEPPGADVYLSSEWVGTSPVEVTYPGIPSKLDIVKEGYVGKFKILQEAPGGPITMELQPDTMIAYNIRKDFRDRFYESFTYLIVSIPVTLAAYSIQEHYSIAYRDSQGSVGVSIDERYRLWLMNCICYTLYTSGLFANTFLFLNTAIAASEYVEHAAPSTGNGR